MKNHDPVKYRVNIFWDDDDYCYLAEMPELPGCMAEGETYEEALRNIQKISEMWLETAKKHGDPIPEPMHNKIIIPQSEGRSSLKDKITIRRLRVKTNSAQRFLKRLLNHFVACNIIKEQDGNLFAMRYFEGLSLEEIGTAIGRSKERARQKIEQVENKIYSAIQSAIRKYRENCLSSFFSVRIDNALRSMNVQRIEDLTEYTEAEMLTFRNVGVGTLAELKKVLSQKGLDFKKEIDTDYARRFRK
jgi:predicted RNase H-like HicB family nuclease